MVLTSSLSFTAWLTIHVRARNLKAVLANVCVLMISWLVQHTVCIEIEILKQFPVASNAMLFSDSKISALSTEKHSGADE